MSAQELSSVNEVDDQQDEDVLVEDAEADDEEEEAEVRSTASADEESLDDEGVASREAAKRVATAPPHPFQESRGIAQVRPDGKDQEKDDDEEEDSKAERFELALPDPLEEVESFEMALPGLGPEKHTVIVDLSEPRRSFERKYKKQLDALRRDAILRQLEGDKAAIKKFLKMEKEAAKQRERDGEGDDPYAHDGGEGSEGADGEDSASDDDNDGDDGPESESNQGAYGALESGASDDNGGKAVKSKAIADLEERLRRQRPYPYWLPHLLANDPVYFERACKAMYGWAVPPPPVPALESGFSRGTKRFSATGTGADRHASRAAVSFQASRGSDDTDDGEAGSPRDEDEEEEERVSVTDPVRKPSDFFLKSHAFEGDTTTEGYSDARTSRYNSSIHEGDAGVRGPRISNVVPAGRSSNAEEVEGSNGTTAAVSSPYSAAMQALISKPRTASIVPTGQKPVARHVSMVPPLTGVAAFTDANYPFYIVWETKSEAWHLLDVHPEVYLLRAKRAEKRRKQAAAARKARAAERRRLRQEKQQRQANASGEDDEEEDDEGEGEGESADDEPPSDGEEDLEDSENSRGSGDDDDDDGDGDGDGDDDNAAERLRKKRERANSRFPQFELESMLVIDALMLAALRCPAALRLMLLQNPGPQNSKSSGAQNTENNGDEEEVEGQSEADRRSTKAKEQSFTKQAAAVERLISLRNIEDWIKADAAVGFLFLSTVYAALLSVRAVDAPRLPYAIVSGRLLFDFNTFFTNAYVLSWPGALRLLGSQQWKDPDPTTKRLRAVASPRSEAAVETMQSLLHAGIVPRHPIALAHLTTPESLQLMLWLLLMIPVGLLQLWGVKGKKQVLHVIESGGSAGGYGNGDPALENKEDDEDEDEDEEEEELSGDDIDDDEVTEATVIERIIARAQRQEREQARDRRRQLKALKKKLGSPQPVKKSSLSACEDSFRSDGDSVTEGVRPVSAQDDEDASSSSDHDNGDEEVEESQRRRGGAGKKEEKPMSWKALTAAIAELERCLLSASSTNSADAAVLLPGALLVQTVLEIRRRIALEKTGKGLSLYSLAFVLERPLAAFARCVEDGKVTGDAVVTANFHTNFSSSKDKGWPPGNGRGTNLHPHTGLEASNQSPKKAAVSANGTKQSTVSRSAKATDDAAEAQQRLLRKQIVYQSDLVLLLLALTTTSDKPATSVKPATTTTATNTTSAAVTGSQAPPRSVFHGGTPLTGGLPAGQRTNTSVVVARMPSLQHHPQGLAATAKGGMAGCSADAPLSADGGPPQSRAGDGSTDAHTEVFHVILQAKLRKQAGKAQVGPPASLLLEKMRSGMFRVLFLALPRFSHRATMQLLCDAAPLYELLGLNERAPLMDLVTSWALEREHGRSVSSSYHTLAEMAATAKGSPGTTSLTQRTHNSNYLDTFVRTFWSEIAYRLEASLYPSDTQDQIRLMLPTLLDKVRECVTAYSKVVSTLVSGKLLKHSVLHRAMVSVYNRQPGANHGLDGKKSAPQTPTLPVTPTTSTTAFSAAQSPATAAADGKSHVSAFAAALPPPDEQVPKLLSALEQHRHVISPYSEEYRKDEERVRGLFASLPMAPRTVFTPELLFALLFGAPELDAVAVRYVVLVRHVLTVREAGPFGRSSLVSNAAAHTAAAVSSHLVRPISPLLAGATTLTSHACHPTTSSSGANRKVGDGVTLGSEVPALEYAIRVRNTRAAWLLVLLGHPLDEVAFGGACTLETLAERCLTQEEVGVLRDLATQRQQSVRKDPVYRFGCVYAT